MRPAIGRPMHGRSFGHLVFFFLVLGIRSPLHLATTVWAETSLAASRARSLREIRRRRSSGGRPCGDSVLLA